MLIHLGEEPLPLGAGVTIIEKVVRAVFVRCAQTFTCPMIVRDNLTQRDVVFVHQVRRQLCGPLNRSRAAVTFVFTHLNG